MLLLILTPPTTTITLPGAGQPPRLIVDLVRSTPSASPAAIAAVPRDGEVADDTGGSIPGALAVILLVAVVATCVVGFVRNVRHRNRNRQK